MAIPQDELKDEAYARLSSITLNAQMVSTNPDMPMGLRQQMGKLLQMARDIRQGVETQFSNINLVE